MSTPLAFQAPSPISERTPLSAAGWCRLAVQLLLVFMAMGVTAVLMIMASVLTFFHARRFNTEFLGKWFCRFVLWICGVKVVVYQDEPFPDLQTVFISNHTSTLDCFILPALGLPNARFFLSGFLRRNPLLCITGYLTGTFWTCPQLYPEKRSRVFQRAENILRKTGDSVYLSPEGQRIRTGEIGHFNKGAFHLATNLKAPIVPFYIAISAEADPGMGVDVRPGVVHVHFRPAIPTYDWKLADLDENRRQVRSLFLDLHQELRLQ